MVLSENYLKVNPQILLALIKTQVRLFIVMTIFQEHQLKARIQLTGLVLRVRGGAVFGGVGEDSTPVHNGSEWAK